MFLNDAQVAIWVAFGAVPSWLWSNAQLAFMRGLFGGNEGVRRYLGGFVRLESESLKPRFLEFYVRQPPIARAATPPASAPVDSRPGHSGRCHWLAVGGHRWRARNDLRARGEVAAGRRIWVRDSLGCASIPALPGRPMGSDLLRDPVCHRRHRRDRDVCARSRQHVTFSKAERTPDDDIR